MPTTDPVAYDWFLRAEFQTILGRLNGDIPSFKAAVPMYRKAIASDPNFALAYARPSFCEGAIAWYGGAAGYHRQLTGQAHADAEHSLKLAPNLAAAHVAPGFSYYHGRRDYAAALREFDAALALSPDDVEALAARGYVQRRQGRFDESIASLQQALAHAPRSSKLSVEIGFTYMLVGCYGEATTWQQRALTLDPRNVTAKVHYSNAILLDTGDIPRALAAVQGDAPLLKLWRVYLLTLQRKARPAIGLLESVRDVPDNYSSNPVFRSGTLVLAHLYRMAGDGDRARPLFHQALTEARTQLDRQEGINLAFAWQAIASAELGLGNTRKALAAMAKSQTIITQSRDQFSVPALMEFNASLYARAGRAHLGVPLLTITLATQGISATVSPVLLWLDPAWDPIRHDPRFEALLQQYARYRPATSSLRQRRRRASGPAPSVLLSTFVPQAPRRSGTRIAYRTHPITAQDIADTAWWVADRARRLDFRGRARARLCSRRGVAPNRCRRQDEPRAPVQQQATIRFASKTFAARGEGASHSMRHRRGPGSAGASTCRPSRPPRPNGRRQLARARRCRPPRPSASVVRTSGQSVRPLRRRATAHPRCRRESRHPTQTLPWNSWPTPKSGLPSSR